MTPTMSASLTSLGDGPGGLVRVAFGVELLELDLAAGICGIVLVDCQLDAVEDVDAELGVRSCLCSCICQRRCCSAGSLAVALRQDSAGGHIDLGN